MEDRDAPTPGTASDRERQINDEIEALYRQRFGDDEPLGVEAVQARKSAMVDGILALGNNATPCLSEAATGDEDLVRLARALKRARCGAIVLTGGRTMLLSRDACSRLLGQLEDRSEPERKP
ncbi:hypothetical protein [Demequina sp. NBRC 110054]|uniref:hypothetical protein n=1 Tax=Demequina sp. NBRC 110054 TaxID=1570343 RepID=UPI0009FEC5A3|nr:hypothetical protein [Demequina sp. NBRC 110054]